MIFRRERERVGGKDGKRDMRKIMRDIERESGGRGKPRLGHTVLRSVAL